PAHYAHYRPNNRRVAVENHNIPHPRRSLDAQPFTWPEKQVAQHRLKDLMRMYVELVGREEMGV
ncbi:MAG: hypothetical protein LQ348_004845, partial [Seirophora lacunosa]